MILLISYDLNGREKPEAYQDVEKMIKEQSDSWAKPLYSQWFVDTTDSINTWNERMKKVTDSDDRWLITRVYYDTSDGVLNTKVWEWFKERA